MSKPIDFVVTWVDSEDPAWRKKKSEYSEDNAEANGDLRYRDWDSLKYFFRCIEKYAPWVNRIFFVTCGQKPEWLNTAHEKLVLVNHEDYIPEEYLPTFNSNVIEIFFHEIDELSEQFVYFNDDMFILSPVKEEDFFVDGKPVDSLAFNAVSAKADNSMVEHIVLNDMELLERHFDKKTVQKQQLEKLLNLKNPRDSLKSLFLYSWKHFTGIENPHVAQPYLKSKMKEVWEAEGKALKETAENRFRSKEDYSLWLVRYWNLLENNYVLKSRKREHYHILSDDNTAFADDVKAGKYNLVCINDSNEVTDFEAARKQIEEMFEEILPEKSAYEI